MNKYNAKKTIYNNVTFDSKKEANRAWELDMLKKAGEVIDIDYQPVFACVVESKKICKYLADFRVTYADGHVEIEDVKGMKTPVYQLKKKLVEALHGIKIIEI